MQIKFDPQDLADVKKLFNSSDLLYNKVAYRAIKKVTAGIKTDADKEIRDIYNLKKSKVSGGIYTKAGTMDKPLMSVTVGKHGDDSSKPISLINFAARQTQKGVSTQVLKSGGRKLTPHLFIALGKNANKHVFVREYRWKDKGPVKKFNKNFAFGKLPYKDGTKLRGFLGPILKRTGPRLADAFTGRPDVYQRIKDKAVARIKKEVEYQMDMALKSLK